MKKTLLALPLGLAFAMAGQSAFANTGTITFTGRIDAGTCPITIVDPITGPSSAILVGYPNVAEFPAIGSESVGREFQLKIKPGAGCPTSDTSATVTFSAANGGAGTGGLLYGLKTLPGAATGIAVAIKDNLGALVDNGVASKSYPVSGSIDSTLSFRAVYKSYLAPAALTAGPAEADVNFTVTIL
jgi:major type 1 subunit fimbrin (pilin)